MQRRALRRYMLRSGFILLGALTAAVPAAAQQQGARPASGMIWIEMPREARQAPAATRLDLAVESFATSANGAISASSLAVQRVMRVLASTGVPTQEIESRGTAIFPEYAHREIVPTAPFGRAQPRVVGYRAVHRITVRVDRAANLGLLIDLARGAGAELVAAESLP